MSLPIDTRPGDLLGKYRILERIGGGGMAEVFRGRHEKLDRTVAIKVLHSSLAQESDFIARFEREARLAANLRHSNIVQVYDFDSQGDRLYMVMELISGGTLKDLLDQKETAGEYLSPDEITRILSQIAGALDYAHEQGMLHRDLKPSNILLDAEGNAYLSDFGIARIIGQSGITRSGAIMGTPAYMSPEQGEDQPLSSSSDLYSLGIILFEMLTGQVPFDAESPLVVLQKQVHSPLPSLSEFRPDLPQELDTLLQKALSKDPAIRFKSARELLNAFKSVKIQSTLNKPVHETGATPVRTVKTAENRDMLAGKSGVLSSWIPAFVIIFLVLVAAGALIWIARQSNLATIKRCTTVKSCEAAAIQLLDANRPALAAEAYAKAASLVDEIDQSEWAQMRCDQADLLIRLKRTSEAIIAYRECAIWTHNETDLDFLRQYAQQKLKKLR